MKGTGTTTIKGTVTLEGDMPDVAELNADLHAKINAAIPEKDMCLSKDAKTERETEYQWRSTPQDEGRRKRLCGSGRRKTASIFDVSELVKKHEGFPTEVKLDQPHCAFVPHAFTLFQGYVNPKDSDEKTGRRMPTTGQKRVANRHREINHGLPVREWSSGAATRSSTRAPVRHSTTLWPPTPPR